MWTLAVAVTVALLPCVVSQYTHPIPEVWYVNQYPDPWWFPADCNRMNKSAICDPNSIISKTEADDIDRLIEKVALDTRCPCYHCANNQRGYVIRVALMEEIKPLLNDSDGIMDRLKNARVFAYLLTKRWKLTGNCNETILIVYSNRDHVLYTMTGSQARKLLTDAIAGEISLDVRPFFDRKETIATGLKEMIMRYRDVFKKTYNREEAGKTHYPSDNRRGGGGAGGLMAWSSPVMLFVTMVIVIIS